MRDSLASLIAIAVGRAALMIFSGVALCAGVLAAIGFALIALYSALTPTLGPAGAAFATSGAALAIPMAVTITALIATRRWILGELPAVSSAASVHSTKEQVEALGLQHAMGWISENPKSATLGALSFGIALGAYPDLRRTLLNGVDSALDQNRATAH
jgi:membrane-bound ClpP family serine protease